MQPAPLVDWLLPEASMRQWVPSFPPLRFLFDRRPEIMDKVLGSVNRILAIYPIHKVGVTHKTDRTGGGTYIAHGLGGAASRIADWNQPPVTLWRRGRRGLGT